MLNLLPKQQKQRLLSEYHWRRFVIVLVFLLVTIVVATAMLVPSFLYSRTTVENLTDKKERLQRVAKKNKRPQLAATLERTENILNALAVEDAGVNVSHIIDTISKHRQAEIALTGFSYRPAQTREEGETIPPTLNVNGVAQTRQSLFDFKTRLEDVALFSSVKLPISNFASDRNIEFSLTVRLDEPDNASEHEERS